MHFVYLANLPHETTVRGHTVKGEYAYGFLQVFGLCYAAEPFFVEVDDLVIFSVPFDATIIEESHVGARLHGTMQLQTFTVRRYDDKITVSRGEKNRHLYANGVVTVKLVNANSVSVYANGVLQTTVRFKPLSQR